ncbi:MAG TPA: Hpt domain-containing protein [Bacteroidia bacterium]|jgi:HPt (histidine-containing phosphotransfer) domain-containing protein
METTILYNATADDASGQTVCELKYLIEMMGAKKSLIKGIMDAFLVQIPEELFNINNAVAKSDYVIIKNLAHSMKSSLSIMGVSASEPLLVEMEFLGGEGSEIGKIRALNTTLNTLCTRAIEEIEKAKHDYE